jgi:hypothetical protein
MANGRVGTRIGYAARRWFHERYGWGKRPRNGNDNGDKAPLVSHRGEWRGVKRPKGVLYFAHGGRLVTAGTEEEVRTMIAAAVTGETGAAENDAYDERGISGLDVYRGRVSDDYNADLKDLRTRMRKYEEMRRSDTAVATVENLISLPLRKATWRVEPGRDDTSEKGVALAARIEQNLFEEMSHSWDDFLRLSLLAPLYGFTVFEQVWEEKQDGIIGWRKFADRDRGIIDRWVFDETGGVQAVKFVGYTPDDERKRVDETVEIEKLLLLTWRREAGNPEGLGLLRQAHKPVTIKAILEEMACIRLERQALGIPVAYREGEWWGQPTEIDSKEEDVVLEILAGLRVNEDVGVVVPAGWKIEFIWPGPADVPFETLIERQHQYTLQTMLTQFVGFSQGGDRGSFGLSKDASSLFLYALGLLGDWIADTFNRYAIPRWMAYNAPDYRPYPRLAHGPVGLRDIGAYGNTIRALFDRNVNVPRETLDFALQEMGMPPLTDEGWGQVEKVREMQLRRGAPVGSGGEGGGEESVDTEGGEE